MAETSKEPLFGRCQPYCDMAEKAAAEEPLAMIAILHGVVCAANLCFKRMVEPEDCEVYADVEHYLDQAIERLNTLLD